MSLDFGDNETMTKLKWIIWPATGLVIIWSIVSAWSISSYGARSEERQADAIVVLGAAAWGARPSPVFRERINHAVNLYHGGYAPRIIFTGGKVPGDRFAESEVAQAYAIRQGVAPEDTLVETWSTNTEENLAYARQIATEAGLSTFIVVSDPFHMKRAMLIAEDLGLEAYSSPTPTSRYRSFATQSVFLMRETYFYQRYRLAQVLSERLDDLIASLGAR